MRTAEVFQKIKQAKNDGYTVAMVGGMYRLPAISEAHVVSQEMKLGVQPLKRLLMCYYFSDNSFPLDLCCISIALMKSNVKLIG